MLMNNQQSDSSRLPESSTLLSAIGCIGVIALFLIIVLIAYYPNRPPAIGENTSRARLETLNEVESKQQSTITSYGWVNQSKNVVRIPMKEAAVLLVDELENSQPEPSKVKAYAPQVIGPDN
jgi:hypothetical protein